MGPFINAAVHILCEILGDAVPAARTTTFTSTGLDVQQYEGNVAVLVPIGAVTGTTTTLDGKIQDSADNSTGWADVTGATFAQVSDTGDNQVQKINVDTNGVKRYIRYVGTIAGSTPSYTFGVLVAGVKKYV